MIQNFRTYDLAVAFYKECEKIKAPGFLKNQLLRASSIKQIILLHAYINLFIVILQNLVTSGNGETGYRKQVTGADTETTATVN